ncbi:hypothetical protein CHUAL_002515 [Chamberlinius hualienensis]
MARTAIVRCLDSEDYLSFSFTYDNAEQGIKERKYNFRRSKTESLQIVKSRMLTNFEKLGSKNKKKRQNQTETAKENSDLNIPVSFLNGETVFSDETTCIEALTQGTALQIGDVVYEIKVNPPMLKSISLPTNIMSGFFVYPKVDVEFADKSNCSFTWFRSTNIVTRDESKSTEKSSSKVSLLPVKDWEKVGDEMCYFTCADDIGRQLRVVCTPRLPEGECGQSAETISSVAVSPGPGLCPFDKRHESTTSAPSPGRLRMVSYNILADLYANSDFSRESLFPYCPPYALGIDYRKQLLLKEIIGYNADIVCLQEVDQKVFQSDLQPAFQHRGMTGLFDLKGGQVAEGLACIYSNTKFKLIDNHRIILAEAVQSSPIYENILAAVNRNENLQERFLKRTTALQVAILESTEHPNLIICVGNTHLYSRADADHVRLLQAGTCLMHLEQIVALQKLKNPDHNVAAILTGDFNSTPEFGVYQLLTSQYIPEDHADWSSNTDEAVKQLSLSHQFNMISACGTPPYTNFTSGFVGCLDYIFIDNDRLDVERVIELPSDEDVRQYTAIPSVTMPSDHIALVCDLKVL